MAEIAAWAEAPARAIGRFDVRTPAQVARRDVRLRGQRVRARGHPHRHVRQRHGRGRPPPARSGRRHAQVRSMLAFLSVNSTFRGPVLPGQRPLPGLRPGLADRRHHVQGQGRHRHALRPPGPTCSSGTAASCGATSRWPASPPRADRVVGRRPGRRRDGQRAGRGVQPRPHGHVHPAARPRRPARTTSSAGSTPSTTGPLYFQMHFALDGLPEYARAVRGCSTTAALSHNVTFFGTPEQMQPDFEGCVRGVVPPSPVVQPVDPLAPRPGPGPAGQARGQQLRLLRRRSGPTTTSQARLRDEMADRMRGQARPAWPRTSPTWSSASSTTRPTPTSGCSAAPGATSPTGCSSPSSWARSGPDPGAGPTARCPSTASTCAAPGATAGPGITFIPGYNCGYEVLDGPLTGAA